MLYMYLLSAKIWPLCNKGITVGWYSLCLVTKSWPGWVA